MKTCTIEDCDRKHFGRGYCQAHYTRMIRGRDINAPLSYRAPRYPKSGGGARKTEAERTLDKIEKMPNGGHWIWTGSLDTRGYGQISTSKSRSVRAHRAVWEAERGPIPEGMVIDHLCHEPSCVNPDHLRVCTQTENMQNRKGAKSGSRSGYRNVSWKSRENKWSVQVMAFGKMHYGGYFSTAEDANIAAIELRERVLGPIK